MIRLALLDDHAAVLTGLKRLIGPARDMEVLAAAGDEVSLARELLGRRPDVLIVDYDPARTDALSLCRRIKSRPATPRVLIYTAYTSPALTLAARAAQADGLIDKSQPAAALLEAIRQIARGETVIPTVGREDFEAAVSRLDAPDLPIFAMLLDGAALPDIAEGLRSDNREAAWRADRIVRRLRPKFEAATARSGGLSSARRPP
jgi:DNA-binding NarL/FixJ family response regulator